MKIRRRNAPLFLLLLPIASVLSAATQDETPSIIATQARDPAKLDPNPSPILDISKPKYDVSTKDAPVDGKDGKPHTGPFVLTEKEQKPNSGLEDSESVLGIGKEGTAEIGASVGGQATIPNDGVMNDPDRELPKQGTTGTEGGVSEKDKARKAQEGQTGERVEKTPDSPKEAPPLPLSEEAKIKSEKVKAKIDEDDEEKAEGLAGLEVLLLT